MATLISAILAAFIVWKERDQVAGAIRRISAATPGLPGRNGPQVTRHEAVEAVEQLLRYAREREGMEQLERFALSAGKSLWDEPGPPQPEAE